jgi:hypothetical protein
MKNKIYTVKKLVTKHRDMFVVSPSDRNERLKDVALTVQSQLECRGTGRPS